MLEAELDARPVAGELAPQRREAVVGIDDRNAASGRAFEDLAFRPRDRLVGAEEFDVRVAGVVDERDVGLRELREIARISPAWFMPISMTA